jgi:hypothetical protein
MISGTVALLDTVLGHQQGPCTSYVLEQKNPLHHEHDHIHGHVVPITNFPALWLAGVGATVPDAA